MRFKQLLKHFFHTTECSRTEEYISLTKSALSNDGSPADQLIMSEVFEAHVEHNPQFHLPAELVEQGLAHPFLCGAFQQHGARWISNFERIQLKKGLKETSSNRRHAL
jgi:hypothetical protein